MTYQMSHSGLASTAATSTAARPMAAGGSCRARKVWSGTVPCSPCGMLAAQHADTHRATPWVELPRRSAIVGATAQQKALQVLARPARHRHRGRARPDQIAHRLMRRVRQPDRRQFPRPMQRRRHHRITTVGLHPVARRHRDQGRCHHDAILPHPDRPAMPPVAAGTCFMAEMQTRSASRQRLNPLTDRVGPVRHHSKVAPLTTAPALRCCGCDRRPVDIQPDEPAVLHRVSPAFWRRGTRQPGATLETGMPPARPLTQPDQNALMGSKKTLTPTQRPHPACHRRSASPHLPAEPRAGGTSARPDSAAPNADRTLP